MAHNRSPKTTGKWQLLDYVVHIAAVLTFLGVGIAFALAVPQVGRCAGEWGIWDPIGLFPAPDMIERLPANLGLRSECISLNEFGDFLAGAFAPFAFLWLVLAVFLQKAELAEQKNALYAQLAESAEHTAFYQQEFTSRQFRELLARLRYQFRGWLAHPRDIDDDIQFLHHECPRYLRALERALPGAQNAMPQTGIDNTIETIRSSKGVLDDLRVIENLLSHNDQIIYKDCRIPELLKLAGEVLEAYPKDEAAGG